MDTQERRKKLLEYLKSASAPLTGSQLASKFSVSRQIIVGDISVIRAMGTMVYATPRGYVLPEQSLRKGIVTTIPSKHDVDGMRHELEIIVDNGGHIRDVIVEHPLYGEIHADLMLVNRHDVDVFNRRMHRCQAKPLSALTDGVHLHTIEVPDQETLDRITEELREAGYMPAE